MCSHTIFSWDSDILRPIPNKCKKILINTGKLNTILVQIIICSYQDLTSIIVLHCTCHDEPLVKRPFPVSSTLKLRITLDFVFC